MPLLGGKSSKALTVSTEIVTPTYHYGDGCVFLLQNYLFICGGTDIESSNKWTDGPKVWHKLCHAARVEDIDDLSYQDVCETQDSINERGVRLSKEISNVAGKCMKKIKCVTTICFTIKRTE